uniref:GAF domain-containing protein n=2 Tax=Aureoumbra lagunensis TaxID=44058 RepID=A0A7S3NE32_9STRA|mmetsp:Transcript_21885/g.33700  ORF Transcript_21885/g.33700 Transcript_21885/m.33700 type:complete len:230 (-) Transcript_21885:2609-3298(-)
MTRRQASKNEYQLTVGITSLLLIVANRLILAGELPAGAQSRADLLGVAAACALLLDGVSRRSIDTIAAPKVSLSGQRGKGLSARLDPSTRSATDWAATTLLESLPDATSVYIWTQAQGTILRLGVLGTQTTVDAEALTLLDARKMSSPTYLPHLQALPARADFPFLPKNSQAVLLIPLRPSNASDDSGVADGIIIVATDRKRAFSLRDQAWTSQFAIRLADILLASSSL